MRNVQRISKNFTQDLILLALLTEINMVISEN